MVGNDETGDGSFENPFATIGQAFNVMSNDAFIVVAPGVYQENLSVNRYVGNSGGNFCTRFNHN